MHCTPLHYTTLHYTTTHITYTHKTSPHTMDDTTKRKITANKQQLERKKSPQRNRGSTKKRNEIEHSFHIITSHVLPSRWTGFFLKLDGKKGVRSFV
mmetsp:Transcript_34155/g.38434  ORF Transcript_34155/g.38434 Transcript_34155/m.38434 type:complete len:97 (+) Transcript_34155:239-529(+)